MIFLEDVIGEKCHLEVYECQCGFHLGLDSSYLEQVEDIEIKCPVCGKLFKTNEFNVVINK